MRFAAGFLVAALLWLLLQAGLTAAFARRYSESPSDVALVLGAAVSSGQPSPVFAARLDHAIELHRRGIVRRLLLTGGVGQGDTVSESQAGQAYAVARGVPAQDILTESVSRTTWQNLVEAQRLMNAAGLSSALLVSDPLHMRRAQAMAERIGLAAQPSPTPATRYRSLSTQVPFLLRELYFQHHLWWFGE